MTTTPDTTRDPFPFGDGWMTGNARDLCRIMVALGGEDANELVRRIATRAGGSDRMVNTATVVAVLDDMTREWDAAHPNERPPA